MRAAFDRGLPLNEVAEPRNGASTSNNARFVRSWWELALSRIGYESNSRDMARKTGRKWFPYNKGGDYRLWYGNQETVVNWENDGAEIRAIPTARPQSTGFYFRPSISWSKISSSAPAFRYFPAGFVFDVAGLSMFPTDERHYMYLLGLCNSNITRELLAALAPTLNFEVGQIGSIPFISRGFDRVAAGVQELVETSRTDWSSYETSWDFSGNPLVVACR